MTQIKDGHAEQAEAYAQLLRWAVEAHAHAKRYVRALERLRRDPEMPRALLDAEISRSSKERDNFAKALASCSRGTTNLWAVFSNCYAITTSRARKLTAAEVTYRRRLISAEYPFRSARKGARVDGPGASIASARASLDAATADATKRVDTMLRRPELFDAEWSPVAAGADAATVEAELRSQPFTEKDGAVSALHMAKEILRDKTAPRPPLRMPVPDGLAARLGKSEYEVLDPTPLISEQVRVHADLMRLKSHQAVQLKLRSTARKRGGYRSGAMMLVALTVYGNEESYRTVEEAWRRARRPAGPRR